MRRRPGFFDYDGTLMQFMRRLCTFIVLNLLFLLCCVPILTIGASLLALNHMSLALCAGEWPQHPAGDFLRLVRRELRRGLVLTLVLVFIAVPLVLDLLWLTYGQRDPLLLGGTLGVGLLLGMTGIYYVPVLCRSGDSLWASAVLSFTLSMRHCLRSVPVVLLFAGAGWLLLHVPSVFLGLLPLLLLTGFSLTDYLLCRLIYATLPSA